MPINTLLFGYESLQLHRADAIQAFKGRSRDFVLREALNVSVFAQALLGELDQQSRRRAAPMSRVAIDGMTPMTQLLCDGLALRDGLQPVVVDSVYQTAAQEVFGVPFLHGQVADAQADFVLSAKIDPRSPTALPEVPGRLGPGTPEVMVSYRRLLEEHRARFTTTMDEHLAKLSRPIVFITRKAQYNQLRLSKALQRAGFQTISVFFDPNTYVHHRGAFHDVLLTDLLSLLTWLNRAKPTLIHTQSWLFGAHIPALIDAFRSPSVAHVCETMDMNRFWFPPDRIDASHLPLLREVWGDDAPEDHLVQCGLEDFIAKEIDGVAFEGGSGHQSAFGLSESSDRAINFPSYALEDFFAEHTGTQTANPLALKLVYAGGIVPSPGRHVPEIFADAHWDRTAQHLLELGFHVDVFNNPGHAQPDTYRFKYPRHIELLDRYPRYQFRPGAMPGAVSRLLAGYDYGLMLNDFEGLIVGDDHFANLVPSKFFMYLEAGLPVLVSDRWRATCELVTKYDIGRAISDAEYRDLPRVLASLDWKRQRANVIQARRELTVDAHLPRLTRLYEAAQLRARDREPGRA